MVRLSEEFSAFMGFCSASTRLNAARDLLQSSFVSGYEEWAPVVKRYNEFDHTLKAKQPNAPDIFFTEIGSSNIQYVPPHREDFQLERHELYRCSWCDKPSAVLKKCTGCNTALYVPVFTLYPYLTLLMFSTQILQ